MNLNQVLTPAEQEQITRRAWAGYYIWKAAWHQVHDPGSTSDRALAMYTTIGSRHGLTDAEMVDIIHQTRKEEAERGLV